jgi:hypothetical protein
VIRSNYTTTSASAVERVTSNVSVLTQQMRRKAIACDIQESGGAIGFRGRLK